MNKCIGCGVELSFDNLGEYCERCFNIKHYNKYEKTTVEKEVFDEILKDIKKDEVIFLVVDILSIPESFEDFEKFENVILIINKIDLMPKVFSHKFVYDYYKRLGFKNVILLSSKKNFNMDYLLRNINKEKNVKNIYFIGYTNSGKSSIINKLLKNYSKNKREITTSMMPATTLGKMKIKFDENRTIIDTPGIILKEAEEILEKVDLLKKIDTSKKIDPIMIQVKSPQTITIENEIKLEVNTNTNMSIYIPNKVEYKRNYKVTETEFVKIERNQDLVIMGLGFIKFHKDAEININCSYHIRESII